jgi:uncharacterized short protein YbdD (DUF466 family)
MSRPNDRLRQAKTPATGLFRRPWQWLRQVTGDAAYENYLRGVRRRTPGGVVDASAPRMSRSEFYLDSLRRRYSTPSRCC